MPKVMSSAPNAGGRHQRGRRVAPTLSEINVVPMVDVMLVLLIIFMVAAPMLQRGLELNLPVARQADDISGERIFVDIPPSFADDRRVFIDAGVVRHVFITYPLARPCLGPSSRLAGPRQGLARSDAPRHCSSVG